MNYKVIHDLVAEHAKVHASKTSLVDGSLRLSFAEVAEKTELIAKSLLAHGVVRGDCVATMAPPSADFWLQFLAVTHIGAIWVGLNAKYRSNDLAYVLGHANPKLVFVSDAIDDSSVLDAIESYAPANATLVSSQHRRNALVSMESFLSRANEVASVEYASALERVTPTDTAAITYTSGTTGRPKGAMLSHAAILISAARNEEWMGDALDAVVMGAPINHVGGLCNLSMNVYFHGGKIVFLRQVDMEVFLTLGEDEQTTLLPLSHTVFGMLLDHPTFSMSRMKSGRLLIHGGSKTTRSYIQKFGELPARIASIYGQTETCGVVTATRAEDSLEAHAETLGAPIAGVRARLADPETDKPLDSDGPGELQIHCDFLFSGYFKDEEATRATFTDDGYLKTGDICCLRDDGNYELVDRLKLMFKSGGYNVYPAEIETVIGEHPAVRDVALLPIPDSRYDEVGCALIALVDGEKVTAEELQAYLRPRIANYKIPKRFEFLNSLPMLPNLKVDRSALAKRLQTEYGDQV